jgi:acyl-CoA synthetase (AMP-forming)/AMP-acid ligase II
MAAHPRTLPALLEERAERAPDAVAYTYLPDRGEPERLTFAELRAASLRLAGRLGEVGARGRPVLLPLEHPLDYATAFFACLQAGAVPASAAPLQRPRLAATAEHLGALASDCGAPLAIGSARTIAMVSERAADLPWLGGLGWVGVEEAGADPPAAPDDPEGLAYLQYTSGSTGRPKAVALPHRALLGNAESLRRALGLDGSTRIVTWLPLSHDMGFVAPVLEPLWLGATTTFLSPTAFVLKPLRWLQAIDAERGTLSAAPNFAYELAVRRIPAEARAELDLSSWTRAVNGAEPIRAETMARFAAAFAVAGFRPETFAPAFGMAEVTCMATCGGRPGRPLVRRFDPERLAAGEAVPAGDGEPGTERVSCGEPAPGVRVEIVDPEARVSLPEGEVGEIWIAGPGVGLGYFGREEETATTFGARLEDDPETPFLRSGDLGFLFEGELFVSGRLKDLIIVRGRNHLPQDIEASAIASHPALAPDAAAAFSIDTEEGEGLAVAGEVLDVGAADPEEITEAVKAALARDHGLRPHVVVLLEPGALPKTTSGKVRRSTCREELAGDRMKRALAITHTA